MPHKHLLFRAEAREKVLRGATALADTVRVTLGPRSRSVLIEKKWGKPIVCNDGVTIAKEFSLEDADEDLGAQMIRGAAERTGDAVGDGTTTATILAHAILADGVRNIAAGASAIDLRRGLDGGVKVAVEALRAQSKPVQTFREKQQVATVSGHNDAEAGDLVARAIDKVGAEGAVTLDESKGTETTLDIVEGLQFDRGYLSPYFVTDPEKMEAVLEEPFILLHQAKIASLKDLLPLLEQIAKQGASLLVIAEDVEGEALATLVVNKLRGIFVNVAVKAAGFGDRRQAMLQDIAVLTGGQLVAQELGIRLENVTPALLGRASRVIVDREHTTIIGGHGDRHAIDGRCQELRKQIADATSDYDREKLEERLAKTIWRRGGDLRRRALRGRDEEPARSARRCGPCHARRDGEGIVPGAGLALLRAVAAVEAAAADAEGDEHSGILLLRRALEAPARPIAENSGVDGGVVVEKMRAGSGNFGFDAARGRYVDLVEAGIIDPTKVVRLALENAVSVAGVLLLTEATMTEVPEPKTENPVGEAA
jgi:chaperonin GroEL